MAAANELAHVVQLAGLIGILLGVAFSMAAGDRPVALAAIFYLLATIVSVTAQAVPRWGPYWIMGIDVAYFIALVVIAGRWRRHWSLWAVAFQLLGVLTHLAVLVQPVGSFQYLTLLALWTYLVMAAICAGAAMAWQRRRLRRFEKALQPSRSVEREHRHSLGDVIRTATAAAADSEAAGAQDERRDRFSASYRERLPGD